MTTGLVGVLPQEGGREGEAMTKSKSVTKKDDYMPTPRERATMEAYLAQQKEAPPAPMVKVMKKGGGPLSQITRSPELAISCSWDRSGRQTSPSTLAF